MKTRTPKTCPQREKNIVVNLLESNSLEEARHKLTSLLQVYAHDHELHYLSGMAYRAVNLYSDAITGFEEAVRLNRRHAPSYFELGLIHTELCRFQKAMACFKKVRNLKYNLAETTRYLSKIEKVAKPKDATLSVCLIVKNEEDMLPRCLRSVKAIADEIIVVDTGSTDQTVDVARKFGAGIYHFKWQNDFSAARNFANEQATGYWILQIDADEELFPTDQFKVRELIHQDSCDGAFVALHCRNSTTFGEVQPTVHYLVRLYKNREDFYYIYPVHEVLQFGGNVIPVDINLLHHGYNLDTNFMKRKRQRNAEILQKRLREKPDDIVSNFYLSMVHLANREFDQCEIFARRTLKNAQPDDLSKQHIYLMSLNNLAIVHVEREDYQTAKDVCLQAIQVNDNYLDPQFFLGLSYFREKNYAEAKGAFQAYLEKYEQLSKQPVFNLFITSASGYLFQVYHFLGKMYRREKCYQSAKEMFVKALELNPAFWLGYADLGYLFLDLEEWENAAANLEKAVQLAKSNPEVNQNNRDLWFDFSNLLRIYAYALKKVLHLKARKRTSATVE